MPPCVQYDDLWPGGPRFARSGAGFALGTDSVLLADFAADRRVRRFADLGCGAGVLTVFAFYLFRGRKWWCLLGQVLTLYWINVELLGGLMYPIRLFGMELELCQQGFALLALVPIWLYRGRQGCHSKPFQYACYAFYPVHMLVLVLALNFVNR